MSFDVSWYIENRVIRASFSGILTTDDFDMGAAALNELVNTGIAPVFVLVDCRDVAQLPPNFQQALQHVEKYSGNPLVAWTIVLTENAMVKFFSLMANKIARTSTRTFKTHEEANAFIAHNAPELAAALAPRREMLLAS